MIRQSLFVSVTTLLLLVLALMSRLHFLAPWRKAIFLHCGTTLAAFVGILGLNIFAATLAVNRKIFLKETGRKLSHFDNQLQSEGQHALPAIFEEGR
jgi:hypothetical protein